MRIVGPSSGSVMYRWICQYEAPSIAAASDSSSGMPWRPARNRITANPMYFQVRMHHQRPDGDRPGSDSQSVAQRSRARSIQEAVDGAVGLEHQAPADSDDDLGDDVRDEDQHPDRATGRASCGSAAGRAGRAIGPWRTSDSTTMNGVVPQRLVEAVS